MTLSPARAALSLSRHSAVRFVVVGAASLAVDATALFLLHGVAGVVLPVATALAFGVAFFVNFGLNRVWAFGASGRIGRQLGRYLTLVVANLVSTVVLVPTLALLGLPYLWAKLVIAGALAIVNYLISKKWIFLQDFR